MFRKLILLIVSMVGIFSSGVMAVGLGEYELQSGLNQPLKAKITLLSAGELNELEVQASLASLQEFEKVGVERLFFLNEIKFTTEKDQSGNLVIVMTTREPIKEPFLNFLIELNWPNGRMIREYTFLLDPPVFDESSSATIQKSNTVSSRAEPKAPQTSYRTEANRQVEPSSYSGSSYGPVSANDTLWGISTKVRPSGVSIQQTLVAIYRANPQAFANGNINNLMKGEVLQIPSAEDIAQVPHRAALQDVVMQNREWRSGGARKIVENRDSGTAENEFSGEPRLTLSTPSSDKNAGGNSSGLSQKLAETESQLIESREKSATLEAQNEELRARLADALSKLEEKPDSAINVEDTGLAALTSKENQTTETSDGSTVDSTTDSAGLDSGKVSSELTDNQSETAENATTAGETTSSADSQASSQPAATPVTPKATTSRQPVFSEPKPEQSGGFFADLGIAVWGGLGAVILLIAFAVFWRMRKRMEEEDFQDDLVASAGAGSMETTEAFELPDVGDDMLVELDMDDETEGGADSDDENFDPLGEADIYIAYGKFEQAESLLLEAIDDNPIRSDYKVKLMECYAETKNKEKFDALAQEVSQAVDADEWQGQVNSLRENAFGESADDEEDFDLPSTEDIFGEDDFESELDDIAASDTEEEDEFDIGMDLDEDDVGLDELEEDTSGAVTETFDSLDEEDFTLDEDDSVLSEDNLESLGDEFGTDDSLDDELDSGLDDDFSLDLDDEDSAESIDLDEDDVSLDIDDDEFNFDDDDDDEFGSDDETGGEDEIATKLDLARAYIDMGDGDGAKEILNEVMAEGNGEQQQQAKSLLERVG